MQTATLLDSLSRKDARNVFRFCSESPRANPWSVSFTALRPIYLGDGSISDVCRRSFLKIRKEVRRQTEPTRFRKAEPGGSNYLSKNGSSMLELIKAAGPHVTALYLSFQIGDGVSLVSPI